MTVHLHSGRAVGSHGVGGEEEGITITTGSNHNSMSKETLNATGNEVTGNDTTGTWFTVLVLNHNDIQHLMAVKHLHFAFTDLAAQRRVCTEKQLLTSLTFGIESTANLCATERAVIKQSAIFACERNALRYALVNDIITYFSQTVYIGFACAVVTTFDGVVVQTIDRVAIVLVVLSGIDTTLCSDRVCTTRAVLDAEIKDIESKFCERCGSRSAGETGTHYDNVQAALISGVNQFLMVLVVGPLEFQGSFRNLRHLRGDDFVFLGHFRLYDFSKFHSCFSDVFNGLFSVCNGFFNLGRHLLGSLYDILLSHILLQF